MSFLLWHGCCSSTKSAYNHLLGWQDGQLASMLVAASEVPVLFADAKLLKHDQHCAMQARPDPSLSQSTTAQGSCGASWSSWHDHSTMQNC